jgi:polysaccharide chain length determinant protein (PEP-CTERM system associated)
LQEAETRLKEFQLKNIQIQVGEGRDTASRLTALGEQLQQARLDLREAESARDSAKAQLGAQKGQRSILGGPSVTDDMALAGGTPEIDARIDAQKSNLDGLLLRFTEQHPDVIAARRLIGQLEDQKKKQIEEMRRAALASPAASGGGIDSLADQEMTSMLGTYEAQIAALRARVAEYSTRYQNALDAMKTAPQIEAEGARLNRDYGINKKNYEDLVARRESAAMSGELEAAAGVADFRLIDPPRVTPQPVWPNRPMLLSAAFGGTVLSGLALAFLLNQLRPVFNSANEMRAQLEIPVLGVVSRVTSPASKRLARIDLTRFLVGSGSLAAAFLTILAVLAVLASRRMG